MTLLRIAFIAGTLSLLSAGSCFIFAQQATSTDWSHIPRSETFDVVTWNIEWFGDATRGPDPSVQYQNVRRVIEELKPDLIGVQEIANGEQFRRLLNDLDGYSGFITNYGQAQQVGFIYNTATVDSLFTNMIDATKGQNSYSWAGRFPLEFVYQAHIGNTSRVMYSVVIHAKAFSDEESWNRRVNASRDIKEYFDEQVFHSPLIFLGDYNDDVIKSIMGSGFDSPYKNFLDDPQYIIVSEPLSRSGAESWKRGTSSGSMIDHITINHHLADNWLQGSEMVYVPDEIINFSSTTSDHRPVLARFDLSGNLNATTSDDPDNRPDHTELLANYPNPFNPETFIPFRLADREKVTLRIFNSLGQQVAMPVSPQVLNRGNHLVRFDASHLAGGIYFYQLELANGFTSSRKMVLVK